MASDVSQVFARMWVPAAPGNGAIRLGKDPNGVKPLLGFVFFLSLAAGYSTNTSFRSSRTDSNEEASGKDIFSTRTRMPSLSSCKRISRPLLKRTASRNWNGVALNCTNVTY